MGADSVGYHERTVLERGDDPVGNALDYYASRGETPMVWGGAGAATLGLEGEVALDEWRAVFGAGGACDPESGEAPRALHAAGDGDRGQPAQIGRRTRRHRQGRRHAPATRCREGRDACVPRPGRPGAGRETRACAGAHAHGRPHMGGVPPCDDPKQAIPRSTITFCSPIIVAMGDEQGRLEGARHRPCPGPPPRRYRRRANGRRRQSRGTWLRHRARPRSIGTPRGLGHYRNPEGGMASARHPLRSDRRCRRP